MELVARCRTEGLVLTVQDVLDNGSITIRQMARMVKRNRPTQEKKVSLFTALKIRPIWWDA